MKKMSGGVDILPKLMHAAAAAAVVQYCHAVLNSDIQFLEIFSISSLSYFSFSQKPHIQRKQSITCDVFLPFLLPMISSQLCFF